MDSEQTSLSLERVLGTLARRAPWLVLCFVVVTGATYGFSKQQRKEYTATASLVFRNNQLGQQIVGLQGGGGGSSESQQTEQATNLKLLQLGDVAAKTARKLGRGLTAGSVRAALNVTAPGEANIINLSATAHSPALTAAIANTYAKQFVAEQQSKNHAYYASALKLVDKRVAALSPKERAGPTGLTLQARAQSLGVLTELRNETVQIAQTAGVPRSPSSPRVFRNTVLGAIVGLLLGLGLAFLLERLDRRIREPKDLAGIYGLPLLGVVPESAALSSRSAGKRGGKWQLPPREEEAFQLIRAHLRYFNIDRDLRTLLVASATPRDGKTTVARHLAGAAARTGWVVLLIEADLRRPILAQQLAVHAGPGLSDVLIGEQSLWSATQMVDLESPSLDDRGGQMRFGGAAFDVLVAGVPLPPNPGKLIESQAMRVLLEQARSSYDLVIIDTPPLAVVPDAFPLLSQVDGVVVVGRIGRNRREIAQRTRETLGGARAPLLGVVANGLKARRLRSRGYAHDAAYRGVESAVSAPASSNGGVPADVSALGAEPLRSGTVEGVGSLDGDPDGPVAEPSHPGP